MVVVAGPVPGPMAATKKTPLWLSKHVHAHSKVSESVQLKITNELTDPTRCEQSRPVKTNMTTRQQHDNLTKQLESQGS